MRLIQHVLNYKSERNTLIEFRKSVDSRDRGIQKVDLKGTRICACLSAEL